MKRLLLLALLCACRPDRTAATPEQFPPIPAYVNSVLGPVRVVVVDSIPSEQPGYLILGRFRPLEREILIWSGVKSRPEQWRILVHETCHLRSWDARLRYTDETVEAMCDVMAYEITGILRASLQREKR